MSRARNPKHRNRRRGLCQQCAKQGYGTESEARSALGIMALHGWLSGEGTFAMSVYFREGCGWWHIGRDRMVVKMIEAFMTKRGERI